MFAASVMMTEHPILDGADQLTFLWMVNSLLAAALVSALMNFVVRS
jgi:hypothetical protein